MVMMNWLQATEKKEVEVFQFLYKKNNVKIRGSLNRNNFQAVSVYFSIGIRRFLGLYTA